MYKSKICGCPHIHFDIVQSTNSYIKENADILDDMTVVTADFQSGGRGRLGNIWLADGGMLPLSILIKTNIDGARLTVISAVAVCRAVEALSRVKAEIKWTNDIICAEHKVCGILCESAIKCSSSPDKKSIQSYVICGMGLNVNQSPEFFKSGGITNGASLYSITGERYDKNTAAELIVSSLLPLLSADYSEVLAEYAGRCLTVGKQVKLIQNNREIVAFARSIADDGCLICENEGGEFIVNAGTVRVRGINGEYI